MSQEALGGQFDMRPNIKAKPGSQGTLFHAPGTRNYPRGYTPERQAEVLDALGGSFPNRPTTPRFKLPGQEFTAEHPGVAAETRMAVDTVARSTVPVEHLHGLARHGFSAGMYLDHLEAGGVYRRYGSSGTKENPREPQIYIAPGRARYMTPIHEIGHHVSAVHEKNDHAAYDTATRRGTEEGFAENYAETHYRGPRGRPERSMNVARDWANREKTISGENDFVDAFGAKRRESPLAPKQFDYNALSKKAKGLPPEHVDGQMSMIDKHTDGYHPPRERPTLSINSEAVAK